MPTSTNSLQRSITVAQLNIRNAPLTQVSGNPNEPAFTIGDWVRQFILAPPFAWRWNRNTTTLTTVIGTQDYQKAVTDFGWLEQASFNDGGSPATTFALEIDLDLTEETTKNQPTRIAARLDDGAGNITFRLTPVPDKVYTVNLTYQKAAPNFAAITDNWAPVPDYLSYLYNAGVLAKAYEYMQDPRYGETMLLFLRQVIAANEGLSESQVNLFLGRFLNTQRESQTVGSRSQLGNQGRGLY